MERALAAERSSASVAGAEARELRVRVEDFKRKVGELEESNAGLGRRASQLAVEMQEAEAAHKVEMLGSIAKGKHVLTFCNPVRPSWRAKSGRLNSCGARQPRPSGSTRRYMVPSWKTWRRSGFTAASSCRRSRGSPSKI